MTKTITYLASIVVLVWAAGVLPQEEFDVSADRLYGSKTGAEETIVLEGRVRIVHTGTVATADTGYYEKAREKITLVGNVDVAERDVHVRGRKAEYLRFERRVVFSEGITATDAGAAISADRGTYDLDWETLEAEGTVTYTEETKSMSAEHIIYHRKEGHIRALGSVLMEDEDYGVSVTADQVTYERARSYGVAHPNPMLRVAQREGRKQITVTADSMELYADERRAVAIGDVTILRGDARATCGRAVFLDDEDKSILSESPLIVDEENSLAGESITILSSEGDISQIFASGNAKSIYHPPDEERSDLTGSEIELRFSEGEISQMQIGGGANAVFSPSGQDTAVEATRNEVRGEEILLHFEESQAKKAKVSGGVTGSYRMEETVEEDIVTYESDTLYYDVPRAVMELKGQATISYKGMKLNSEAIEYSSKTHNLYATINPVLWEGNEKITGSSMTYNLKTKRGAVVTGRTGFEKGIYTGRLIRKTGEQALNVEGGTYTSCERLDPHFSFTSSNMKIYANDKVIARPVILRVRGFPVFALPFFMFPIKRGRHSGILIPRFEFGFDEARGRFIRNAGYYWAPSDYFDLALWGDYYDNSRGIGHMEGRYKVRYLLSGNVEASYSRDVVTDASRWDLSGRHTQELGENGRLVVHADFVSDKQYRKETSEDLEKALRRVLESDISYSKSWEGLSVNVAAERRENLDTDEVSQKFPVASLLLTRRTLFAPAEDKEGWHRGTYISGSASVSNRLSEAAGGQKTNQAARLLVSANSDLNFRGKSQSLRSALTVTGERKGMSQWCSECVDGKPIHSALSNKTDLIAKFNPFGWLNFNPSVTVSSTLFDQDRQGKNYRLRLMYWGGFDSKVTLYRTYFPRIGPVQAVRHVITPSIAYTHRPDFSRYSGRFFTISGISGEVGQSRTMSIRVSNRLQAKVGTGREVKKINDLLALDSSTSYDFLYKDKGKSTPLSTIANTLRFYPSQHARFDVGFSNDPDDLSFESLKLTARASYIGGGALPPGFIEPELPAEPNVPEEGVGTPDLELPTTRPWRVDVVYRYNKAFDGGTDNYWLEVSTGFNLTRNWRFDYSGRFDLSGRQTVYQEYSIYRDLHCWEARFVRRYSGGEWQYYFRLNIKAHPEIYAERGLRALYRSY
jgi:lipopolysaccharide assembly outer membrane protein LptD (OstA)